MAACRPGFIPWPAVSTLPSRTSSILSPGTPARCRASATAVLPRSVAGTSANEPLKVPTGVRTALKMTASSNVALPGLLFLPTRTGAGLSLVRAPGGRRHRRNGFSHERIRRHGYRDAGGEVSAHGGVGQVEGQEKGSILGGQPAVAPRRNGEIGDGAVEVGRLGSRGRAQVQGRAGGHEVLPAMEDEDPSPVQIGSPPLDRD